MMNYVKLVNFELGRFMKIYLVLIGITVVSQIAGVMVSANSYLNIASEEMNVNSLSMDAFLQMYGVFSMNNVTRTLWFFGPIALCAVTLLIYVLFIWYRDWFGKNTFIYRLLMLPTERINIYLAKATAIFFMVLGLIACQLALIPIEGKVMQWMVPLDLRIDLTTLEVIHSFEYLGIMIPTTFSQFLVHYGIGLMAVLVMFTAVLFERCFRMKGIILGVVYAVISFFAFISPLLINEFVFPMFLYPGELFILECVAGFIVIACAIWTGHYLLNRKIRV
ncbi:hypothetical protein D8M04_15745 [Oceanobacillus piezotolerans]|uniref:Uncharacterized protein n=1 Tax=Oceanobacillus piezotolerans TaxID=2448030 RepID=A0A498DJC3_9BACI|nr:hypothetical protein [Oceanobacillus piezotolerans]RLL42036.1 hypothetical protein D8M04_15745 [Oceanobacillus piezotolerans]